jgi:hypothetical protein
MERKLLLAAVELVGLAVAVYALDNRDAPVQAAFWRLVMQGSHAVARKAGRLAIKAELAYHEAVTV